MSVPRLSALVTGLAIVCCMFAVGGCDSGKPKPGPATGDERGGPALKGDLSGLSGTIKINGSSSLFPVTAAAAEAFEKATDKKVRIPVGKGGTGSGFREFLRGEIDICDASRPITADELEQARQADLEFIELPICFDALTIAVHPSNELTSITTDQLRKMWEPDAQDKIKRWNQVDPAWPDEELVLFGAGSNSGTFEYFTGAVTGTPKKSRGDYTPNENDNILVQGIAGDKRSLGYIPFAYYRANQSKLKALAVDWDKDEEGAVAPTLDAVLEGKYNPFSRPLFLYVNRRSADRPEVKAFIEFYIENAERFSTEKQYIPLTPEAYKMDQQRFVERKTGTGFKGEPEFGMRVESILQRPPQ